MPAFDTIRPERAAAPFGAITLYRIARRLDSWRLALIAWNERRITRRMLEQLSDRELDDIGLSRADIAAGRFMR